MWFWQIFIQTLSTDVLLENEWMLSVVFSIFRLLPTFFILCIFINWFFQFYKKVFSALWKMSFLIFNFYLWLLSWKFFKFSDLEIILRYFFLALTRKLDWCNHKCLHRVTFLFIVIICNFMRQGDILKLFSLTFYKIYEM